MKQKLNWILLVEAAALVVYCVLGQTFDNAFTSIMAFPFEQIALSLRAFSVAGVAGNIIAIVIYCAICLAPAAYFVVRAITHRSHASGRHSTGRIL